MSNQASGHLQGALGAQGMHGHHAPLGALGAQGYPPVLGAPRLYPSPIHPALTVSDVERLAKAGVKMDFKDIAECVVPDPVKKPPRTLIESFWERWHRANPVNENSFGVLQPWQIAASTYGDKVFVFVAPIDAEPFILEDEKLLYPSDALIAKLHLRERTK